ncbi:MAG: hypothetical protein IKU34_02675 [Clostridia bacterium]|nr:hypothetical protein [Clostridia bacterium]
MTEKKRGISLLQLFLLIGMGLMIPCYLFTAGNTLFAPFELYNRSRAALVVLTAALTALLCFLLYQADRREAFFARHEKKTLVAAAAFYFAVQLILASALRFEPATDAEQCHTAAKLIVDTGTFGNNERSFIYFTRYPFNLGLVYLLAAIFRLSGALGIADRFMPVVVVAALLFTLGLLCGARIARRIGGVKAQTRMLILFASCLPFLYCPAEMYTDVFALAFPTMTIYLALRIGEAKTRREKLLFALLFALCTFVGAQIRFTCVVAAIACMIVLLFKKRVAVFMLAGVMLCAVFAAGGALMDWETHKHLSEEDIAKNELPRLHHIAMGLPVQVDEGYGQYGYGKWLIFSTSFEDPQERKEALLTEVIDRIYYLRYPSRLIHMMSRKLLSTFGNGTFVLHEIIQGDRPQVDHPVKWLIFEWGDGYKAYYHLTTALFTAQMLLACAACLQAIFRRDTRGAAVFIALLGIFLVLCMWETRARYFFSYQMLLLLAAALLEVRGIRKTK